MDIPIEVKQILLKRGVKRLYPPQEKAVEAGVLKGKSIVVSAPTASGKTLIAELAITKKVLKQKVKALYLTPLRALAYEKWLEFKKYEEEGLLKVAVTTGDYDSDDRWLSDYDVIVCTNEKLDSLIRHNAPWLKDVGIVVSDEVHLINDPERGPTLEVVLARLKSFIEDIQIVALSATISNAKTIAEWLDAVLVESDWRPVPLKMGVCVGNKIIFDTGEEHLFEKVSGDSIIDMALEVVKDGGQCLIFANTRQNAVRYANRIARHLEPLVDPKEAKELCDEMEEGEEASMINEELINLMMKGVAFHHAGLSARQRRIIEEGFRNFKIKVVCSTPTLAAGVNLPARRVVIQDYRRYEVNRGMQRIPILEFHQMAGRAGRPQYDDYGEAIAVAKTNIEAYDIFSHYINSKPEEITSQLTNEGSLRKHVLATIASMRVATLDDIINFISKTFYAHQFTPIGALLTVRGVLRFLEREGFIAFEGRDVMKATDLGRRVSELYIDPLSAVILLRYLKKMREATTLGYLHLICKVSEVPKLYARKKDIDKIGGFVLESDEVLMSDDEDFATVISEVKTALLIYDWINEVPEDDIVSRYDVGPGDIHAIAQTAEWICYTASEIAKIMGFTTHSKRLSVLAPRIRWGVREELLELLQLEGIGRVRARILYRHGYKGLKDLAKANIVELASLPRIGPKIAQKVIDQAQKRLAT
ncbi:MAG: DEAD/DEAH box helicase [Candidatus Nezhaarchaeales archaeon]